MIKEIVAPGTFDLDDGVPMADEPLPKIGLERLIDWEIRFINRPYQQYLSSLIFEGAKRDNNLTKITQMVGSNNPQETRWTIARALALVGSCRTVARMENVIFQAIQPELCEPGRNNGHETGAFPTLTPKGQLLFLAFERARIMLSPLRQPQANQNPGYPVPLTNR